MPDGKGGDMQRLYGISYAYKVTVYTEMLGVV